MSMDYAPKHKKADSKEWPPWLVVASENELTTWEDFLIGEKDG